MLEDVRFGTNINVSKDDARIKSSDFAPRPSFKGDPNGVDNTPANDTYTRNEIKPPHEEGFGTKFIKYIIPTWMGLHWGTELFNKANGGEYEKSLVGRFGKWGDKLSESSVVKNSFVDNMRSYGRTIKTNIKSFILRHERLRAMYETPTAPESSMVTNFMETQAEADLKEGLGKIKDYVEKQPTSLKSAGATKDEIEALKRTHGSGMFGGIKNEAKVTEEYLLQKFGSKLGNPNIMAEVVQEETAIATRIQGLKNYMTSGTATQEEVAMCKEEISSLGRELKNFRANKIKKLKLSSLGIEEGAIAEMMANPAKNAQKIEQLLMKGSKDSPKLKPFYNKILSIRKPATKLGKFFPKMAKLGMRGLTFGGGLFNSLFVAFFLGDAVKSTIDAPKEKKTGTFVHGLLDAMSWVVAMPLAIKAMHSVNGLKNIGKSKFDVARYKDALKTFNQKVASGALRDKALYEQEFNELMNLKNAGTAPKGLSKVLSKVASFLSIGLEQPARYKEATQSLQWGANLKNWATKQNFGAMFRNLKRNLPNIGKNVVGYPLRFGLYMAIFAPIVDKVFSGVASAIFGKPYDPDKHKEMYEAQEARKASLYSGPSIAPNPAAVAGLDNLDVDKLNDDNLVKQELIKRGLAKPSNVNPQQQGQNTKWDSVNGVSVTTTNNAEPFMPPNMNNEQPNGANNPNYPQGKNPNVSEYDTIPRSYVPDIGDINAPRPYGDPLDRTRAEQLLQKSDKVAADIEKYLGY